MIRLSTPSRRRSLRHYKPVAKNRLRRFKMATTLAFVSTSVLLLLFDSLIPATAHPNSTGDSVEEAAGTIKQLYLAFEAILPKLVIAVAILLIGWLLSKVQKWIFYYFSAATQRSRSVYALLQLGLLVITIVAAVSVLVGDIRALVGSIGLIGLALSWSLQSPIESFSGWILNMFRSYYRIGDRIEVGSTIGDVFRIDFLTTTVWEIGGPGKAVKGAQPTGALTTFPNSEILRSSIINYTRDFDFIWDELVISFANETNLRYASDVLRRLAEEVLGEEMQTAARTYRELLEKNHLAREVEDHPQLYFSLTDSYINCTIRYLVPIHSKRRYASILLETILEETGRQEHAGKIVSALPRSEIIVYSASPRCAHDR